ncbi:MAG: protein kinase domain-containing protein, partial [Gammaproteobacteria bacterium]
SGHRNALDAGARLHWYQIDRILGQGSFGITYLARDVNLDSLVAIKEYMPTELAVREHDSTVHPVSEDRLDNYRWGLERFLSEAKTLARFKHPNIVRVLNVFEEHGTAYIVMEYEDGDCLADLLHIDKYREESFLRRILYLMLDGLILIHDAGFIHRDIKPGNIFVRRDASPVLLDFGSARLALGGRTQTLTGLVTPGFAPYEQYHGGKEGPWTDIYGLGATCYRAIVGKTPIDALTRSTAWVEKQADPLEPVSQVDTDHFYSPHFLNAIDCAMSFRESERPQSIPEWKRMLEGDRAPLSSPAMHAPAPTQMTPTAPAQRRPAPPPTPRRAVPATPPSARPRQAAAHAAGGTAARASGARGWIMLAVAALVVVVAAGAFTMIENQNNPAEQVAGSTGQSQASSQLEQAQAGSTREPQASAAAPKQLAEQPAQTKGTTQEVQPGQSANRVAELLALAAQDMKASRVTSPAGANALARYREVLKLEPSSPQAEEGMTAVANHLLGSAREAIVREELRAAQIQLELAAAIRPESPELLVTRSVLEAKVKEREANARKQEQQRLAAALAEQKRKQPDNKPVVQKADTESKAAVAKKTQAVARKKEPVAKAQSVASQPVTTPQQPAKQLARAQPVLAKPAAVPPGKYSLAVLPWRFSGMSNGYVPDIMAAAGKAIRTYQGNLAVEYSFYPALLPPGAKNSVAASDGVKKLRRSKKSDLALAISVAKQMNVDAAMLCEFDIEYSKAKTIDVAKLMKCDVIDIGRGKTHTVKDTTAHPHFAFDTAFSNVMRRALLKLAANQ